VSLPSVKSVSNYGMVLTHKNFEKKKKKTHPCACQSSHCFYFVRREEGIVFSCKIIFILFFSQLGSIVRSHSHLGHQHKSHFVWPKVNMTSHWPNGPINPPFFFFFLDVNMMFPYMSLYVDGNQNRVQVQSIVVSSFCKSI
jgi:hypothetical protein